MSIMRCTTEQATDIRKILKQRHGWTSRQVSVRARYFSMGSAIDCEIRDPAVALSAVQAVAGRAESIARCAGTGEILGGGNTYVHVRYSAAVEAVMSQRYAGAVAAALAKIEPGSHALEPVGATGFHVGRPNEWRASLWDDGGHVREGGVDELAYVIARNILERTRA